MNASFGGWGGRYIWRQPWLESRPHWTNGRASRDTVVGMDGKSYTSDQATIWRWREAFMHDFAARMQWTIADVTQANHNPDVIVNGIAGKAPIAIETRVGTPIRLDASASSDATPTDCAFRGCSTRKPEAACPRLVPVAVAAVRGYRRRRREGPRAGATRHHQGW
jgi:hypothetical protein